MNGKNPRGKTRKQHSSMSWYIEIISMQLSLAQLILCEYQLEINQHLWVGYSREGLGCYSQRQGPKPKRKGEHE